MSGVVGYPVEVRRSDETEERLRRARNQLEAGKRFRESERHSLWRQSEAQYEGQHWQAGASQDPTADLIVVNMSFSTVNTIVPYVTSESPRFLVSPFSADATIRNARLQQAFLNRIWQAQKTGAHEALEAAAVDYLIYGDGYLKVSWGILEKQLDNETFTDVAEIFVDKVDPWDVWIDPLADGIHNARWVAQRIVATKRELEQDEVYANVDFDELTFGNIEVVEASTDREPRLISEGLDGSEDYIILYEFWDLIDRVMLTFADTGDLPLRVVEEAECPIVQIANYRIPRSPYHMGELEQIWPIQQELNKTRSQLITHRRRNVAKILIREDAVTGDAKEAISSPIVNQLVPIKGDLPLDSVVKPVQLSTLPAEAYNSADQAMRDIYEISGVNEYLRGATPEIRRTATEASIIEGASNVKTRAKLAAIERATRKVGTLILQVAKAVFPLTDVDEMSLFLTGREAEAIARDDALAEADELASAGDLMGAQETVAMAGQSDVVIRPSEEIFAGEYEVEVESGSTELRNPLFKEQKYREMAMALVQMAPALAQSGVTINLRKTLEQWFEAAGISDVDGMFEPMGFAPPMGAAPGPSGLELAPGQPAPAQPPLYALGPENTGALPAEVA